ncbi:MAG TPA: carboxypeptidase-like regulatory domain-containing protein, partial [Chitinophaga sp.]|nr:carboxypeptidase-like regulatory domain-containing protein [Chitinophaga sp.]
MNYTLLKVVTALLCLLCWSGTLLAQQTFTVTGEIKAPDGTPIIGATVSVKGKKIGTVSDATGAYKLKVPGDAILVVSFIGYLPKEIPVNNRTDIDVQLSDDQKKL